MIPHSITAAGLSEDGPVGEEGGRIADRAPVPLGAVTRRRSNSYGGQT
jgi:hypothetical protein